VALPGFDNGGYGSSAWAWYTLALASLVAIRALEPGLLALGRPELLMLLALAGLAGWMWVSSAWAVAGSEPGLEARRCVLYVTALLAFVTCASSRSARVLASGILLGIAAVTAYALVDRSTTPNDELEIPFQGTRLVGTVGYSNALGVLAAIGIVLAAGLASSGARPWLASCLRAAIVVLTVALTLTESAGACVALAAGVAGLLLLAQDSARRDVVATLAVVVVPAGAASVVATEVAGLALALVLVAAGVVAAAAPALVRDRIARGRRLAIGALVAVAAAAVVGVAVAAPSSLGLREHYWRVALDDVASRPLHGSGAGSFRATWLDERPVAENARDAHSLYVETLGELGLIGLLLVGVVVLTPLVVGIRRGGDLLTATATSAFLVYVVHAAVDWDWEMPVVTITALGCGAVALAARRPDRSASWPERALVFAAALSVALLALLLLAQDG
jgi:O-antigen ligase